MINATLKRKRTGEKGTFGELYIIDETICYTLEPPWLDNETNKSCIPEGKYYVTPWVSPTHGECFKIWNVPDREDILIHKGNWLKDTLGCILVGLETTEDMVQYSEDALDKLKDMFGDQLFKLTIIEDYV
jgi:hypothetical protein